MSQQELRTYRRRNVTRESGYHTCEETTGGECLISHAERYICKENMVEFSFYREQLNLIELFNKGISIIAFGGYLYTKSKCNLEIIMKYIYENEEYQISLENPIVLEENNWKNIGIHSELTINKSSEVYNPFL